MEYADYLKEKIKESGKTLEQISKELKLLGHDMHPTYISKLRLGSRLPPSPIKTAALAKVLDADPDYFLALHKKSVSAEQGKEFTEALEFIYPNLSPYEMAEKELILTQIWREKAMEDLELYNIEKEKVKEEFDVTLNYPDILLLPVLGKIPAGDPIEQLENLVEYKQVPNPGKYKENELFILNVTGDSMIGSRIFEGDQVLVWKTPEVNNGDIAVVNVNGEDATLKRVKKTDSGQYILYPDNPKYEPIIINNERARIIGKVVQVMFEPK